MPSSPTPAQSPDPDRPRGDKRERILDAAVKVFAEQGYHGARVSDIAGEAGIAYGLVYHYFKNKEEILSTLFEERWKGFLGLVEEIAGGDGTAEERLVSLASLVLVGFRLRPDWVKVLVLEIQRSPRFAEPEHRRAVGALFDAVERVLRQGQERGEIDRGVDPAVAVTVFMGALDLVITQLVLGVKRIDGGEADERAYYERVARSVVSICLNGIAAR